MVNKIIDFIGDNLAGLFLVFCILIIFSLNAEEIKMFFTKPLKAVTIGDCCILFFMFHLLK